jgi:hypothetical protein
MGLGLQLGKGFASYNRKFISNKKLLQCYDSATYQFENNVMQVANNLMTKYPRIFHPKLTM